MDVKQKREREKAMLKCMISVYCRGNHKEEDKCKGVCEECQKLQEYAFARTERCPFMETKTFCSACKVHCYSPEMQDRVREVMKYSGPRMLLYHPGMVVRHMLVTLQNRKREE